MIRNRSGIRPDRIRWYIPGSSLRLARSPVAPKRTITWSFGLGISCCWREVIGWSLCCFPMAAETNHGTQYDPAALDRVERRFWRDIWKSMPHELTAEHGVELRDFGALQATLTRDLPQVPILNLVLGAPQASEADLDYAIAWADEHGVSPCVPVTPGLPGSGQAEEWLLARGFEHGYA